MGSWDIDAESFPGNGAKEEQAEFLLQFAVLAPSSHNTQPWRFSIRRDAIRIFADESRWLKVADPSQRELYISLGCALENLLIAARHFGYSPRVAYFPEPERGSLVAEVTLGPRRSATSGDSGLFHAITERHTNHRVYQARKVRKQDLEKLADACRDDGLRIDFTDEECVKLQADEIFAEGVIQHFKDRAYTDELAYWVGQGVFGTPWFISKIGQLAIAYGNRGRGTAAKGSKALLSASHLGLISSRDDDHLAHVKTGQAFERLALTATSLGIRVQPISEPCEIPQLRRELQALVPGLRQIPQHPFRLGYAEAENHTPRRPLADVLA